MFNSLEKLSFDREIQVLQIVNHPFVIKYFDFFEYKNKYQITNFCIVTEFIAGGDLDTYLKKTLIYYQLRKTNRGFTEE